MKEKLNAFVNFRMKRSTLAEIKRIAEKKDIPYQSLMRLWVVEGLSREQEKEAEKKVVDF